MSRRTPEPERRHPDVVPMLDYEDGAAAITWLERAFGFRELNRFADADGRVTHAELQAGGGLIMLATAPTPHYESPRKHRQRCVSARLWLAVPWVIDGVLVYVDDVTAHYVRAKAEGAIILTELEGGFPGLRYRAEDVEGHRWMFIERSGSHAGS